MTPASSAESVTTQVWWVYPPGDVYQHATVQCPPHGGGIVTTLGGYAVEAPPAREVRLHLSRPFCGVCMTTYLIMPGAPIPLWSY